MLREAPVANHTPCFSAGSDKNRVLVGSWARSKREAAYQNFSCPLEWSKYQEVFYYALVALFFVIMLLGKISKKNKKRKSVLKHVKISPILMKLSQMFSEFNFP